MLQALFDERRRSELQRALESGMVIDFRRKPPLEDLPRPVSERIMDLKAGDPRYYRHRYSDADFGYFRVLGRMIKADFNLKRDMKEAAEAFGPEESMPNGKNDAEG